MKNQKLLTVLIALLLAGCALHEGEHVQIAGIDLEGMMWPVSCEPDMLHELAERWEYESPNYCDAENLNAGEINGYGMCAKWMVIRYRREAAKREYRRKCEQSSGQGS